MNEHIPFREKENTMSKMKIGLMVVLVALSAFFGWLWWSDQQLQIDVRIAPKLEVIADGIFAPNDAQAETYEPSPGLQNGTLSFGHDDIVVTKDGMINISIVLAIVLILLAMVMFKLGVRSTRRDW